MRSILSGEMIVNVGAAAADAREVAVDIISGVLGIIANSLSSNHLRRSLLS